MDISESGSTSHAEVTNISQTLFEPNFCSFLFLYDDSKRLHSNNPWNQQAIEIQSYLGAFCQIPLVQPRQ
jgi:hypothetical protein